MAQDSRGTSISYDLAKVQADGSLTYIELGEVTGLSPSGQSVSVIDATALGDAFQTFLPGTYSPGTVSVDMNFEGNNTSQAAFLSRANLQTLCGWKIQYPKKLSASSAGVKLEFDAFVSDVGGPNATNDGAMTMSITLTLSGEISRTAEA